MLSRSNWLILGLAVLAATAGYVAERSLRPSPENTATEQPSAPAGPLVGQLAPALSLPDLEGKPQALEQYRGKRVLLNFWATWCVPCLKEMPALDRAQANFAEHGGIVVGIAMDEPTRVQAFLTEHPVSYTNLIGQIASPSTSQLFGNAAQVLPYSVLIDTDGRILASHAGILSDSQLHAWMTAKPGAL